MARTTVTDLDTPAVSFDAEQVSIVTATALDATDPPGRGSIYNPATLAAGRLFHIHKTNDQGVYLALFSASWTAATAVAGTPGAYSAKTAVTRPSCWWIRPSAMGQAIAATDKPGSTPGQLYPQGASDFVVVGASSYGTMMYVLGTQGGGAFLASYVVGPGVLDLLTTEWLTPIISGGSQINWDRGIYAAGNQIYFLGGRASDLVTFMAKRVMITKVPTTLYFTGKGWSADPTKAAPIVTTAGNVLASVGPMSLAIARDDTWLLAGSYVYNGSYQSALFSAKHPALGFSSLPGSPLLGPSTLDARYVGAYFIPAVTPNFDNASANGIHAMPYTYTFEASTAMRTNWGLATGF